MKQLITTFFVLAMLCNSTGLIAQNVSDMPSNSFPFNLTGQTVMSYDNRYEGIKGSYTFFEEFKPGTVELNRGKFNNVLINYDAYNDDLLAMNDKIKEPVQMRKDMVLNFTLKNEAGEEYTFTKHSVNGIPTFLLDLVRDTISLFCRVGKEVKKAEVGGAYNTSEKRYDEFITVYTYYVSKENNALQEIQKSKKGILQAFPEYENQLSIYLKKNKISFNDYNQMKLFVTYINSL
ncbi:MAG TPA: hypothetical protein VFU05_03920 [Cyclobacteriaceae bacterium]|nr:hypothetical protein [Cyclobacteriaceae bacterium]